MFIVLELLYNGINKSKIHNYTMYVFASKDEYFSNKLFHQLNNKYEGKLFFVKTKKELKDKLEENPEKIFFFHWSYIVKKEVCDKYVCINLHTSNLPYGKGGSPLQNQILDKVYFSRVNAIRMSEKVDAGPIYCSHPVTLQGSLFDIWNVITKVSFILISKIIDNPDMIPVEQKVIEDEIIYKRRKINEITPKECNDLEDFYDRVRMLDGPSYPNTYIVHGDFKIDLTRAQFDGEKILCDAIISKK